MRRRRRGAQLWHSRQDCPWWPVGVAVAEEREDLPPDAMTCRRCEELELGQGLREFNDALHLLMHELGRAPTEAEVAQRLGRGSLTARMRQARRGILRRNGYEQERPGGPWRRPGRPE